MSSVAVLLLVVLMVTSGLGQKQNPATMDCKCENTKTEGGYCGGSPYLTGNGCTKNVIFQCSNKPGFPSKLTKCATGEVCVLKYPGQAACQKPVDGQPGPTDCKCNNQVPGKYCGKSPSLKNGDNKCKKNYLYECFGNGREGLDPVRMEECYSGQCEFSNHGYDKCSR